MEINNHLFIFLLKRLVIRSLNIPNKMVNRLKNKNSFMVKDLNINK